MRFTRISILSAVALSLCLGGSSLLPIRAQQADPPAQPTDTPGPKGYTGPLPRDEYEKAWVRLFDGETTFGWQARGDATQAKAGWTIADESLQAMGSGTTLATTAEFGDFLLAGECAIEAQGAATISLRAPKDGAITPANAAQVRFLPAGRTAAKSDTLLVPQGKWKPFSLTLQGGKLIHSPDSKGKRAEAKVPSLRGVVALTSTGKGTVKFRNLKLQPLGFKSLFNGKDLTGWKPIPDHPSVFSVTPEGWLNIKNGNGDIQSDSQYGDFVLTLDVYSNGDHLNSGVFFREIPGQFWAGYEDQIRNQWEGEDRTKAVDYGTGGIYNRQPARKVVSSDREWFTMTLVASGTHIASYVDGYLVADFTDTRPVTADKNARNGLRTEPGCIGLQGHDPTTDLSFRNIRVVELPAVQATGR